MAFLDRRTVSVLCTILSFAVVLSLLWLARLPVIAFIFALFFAQLLEPVVARLESRLGFRRGRAVAITYLAIVLALVIFAITVGPIIWQQGQKLAETLPGLLENVRSGNIAWQVGQQQGWSYQTEMRIQRWLVLHQEDIARYAKDVTLRLEQLGSNLLWVLLVPVMAVFFLKDRPQLRASLLEYTGASQNRVFLESVLDDLDTMLAQYVRAQLLLAFFGFVAYFIFLLVARFPYAPAVAAIGGVLEFIPFIGPLLTLAILMSIAVLTGYPHWLLILAFWVIWRGVQDYINTPRVMGEGLDLHPLLTIFAILVGGEIGGVLGLYLSIPAVATARILWMNWSRRITVKKVA
jgi:predicted PurR-regulated permease PerM